MMRPHLCTLEATGEPQPTDDTIAWARWFETADRLVARDELPGDVIVSTVFLGIDHNWTMREPAVLYETLVFYGEQAGEMQRYATRAQALEGHAQVVQALRGAVAIGQN